MPDGVTRKLSGVHMSGVLGRSGHGQSGLGQDPNRKLSHVDGTRKNKLEEAS